MSPPRRTHCKRGHELSPENTYVHIRPGFPDKRTCKACMMIMKRRQWIARPPAPIRDEPNTLEIDGVVLTMSAEIPMSDADVDRTPSYHATFHGSDLGQVYQLELIDEPTWFARHPGEEPTGPYPDIVAALSGLIAS